MLHHHTLSDLEKTNAELLAALEDGSPKSTPHQKEDQIEDPDHHLPSALEKRNAELLAKLRSHTLKFSPLNTPPQKTEDQTYDHYLE